MENRKKNYVTIDGNTAAAHVAYAYSEVAAIYPITPSSTMGELADEWASKGRKNIFNQVVDVIEMQSEAGAAGAVHGSLSAGALTTTFTASQGLLLMTPNMFKIAGELLPTVFHVSARAVACQALSIFGDHSDVMSVRGTGFAMLASANVQEAADLAIVAHLSTLESRVPFLHFFDGFRTSNEDQKAELPDYETLKSLLDYKFVKAFKADALNPEHPMIKVGAENPDTYFQGRETVNQFYYNLPEIVKNNMKKVSNTFGRTYNLFDYVGDKEATKIIIAMCSGTETIEQTVNYMNKKGEKVGLIKVRLYRPFSVKDFVDLIPKTAKKIAVLDRTKEPGAIGEPLYLDVMTSLKDRTDVKVIGGRFGLSSKEFTPAMVKGVYDHLDGAGFHDFSIGINDDLTHRSISYPSNYDAEPESTIRCKFWGFGSDGTVGANKNSIKIIGDNTDKFVQGYFEYDSKKSGGVTISHLRFGDEKIQSQYLLTVADFIALHKFSYIGQFDILEGIKENGTFLISCPWAKEEVFNRLSKDMQETIIKKHIKVYTIDANKIAKEAGMPGKINVAMQVAFFKLANIIDFNKAVELIKKSIEKTYGKKGEDIIKQNFACVDKAITAVEEVPVPNSISISAPEIRFRGVDSYTNGIVKKCADLRGNTISVAEMPLNGAIGIGTTKFEKRGIALEVPKWYPENCIQCGQCSLVCPHAAIRIKQIEPKELTTAPASFKTIKSNSKNTKELQFKVQVYPEDCTGCQSCVRNCPAKTKAILMSPIETERKAGENENAVFFDNLPENILDGSIEMTPRGTQLHQPLFEFSGACAGCGETPYVKLLTQLFGDRMIVANATGCSSIYGGTFPTIPYCKNKEGKGPAWANSLFEDNAEYGFGMRLAVDANRKILKEQIELLLKSGTTNELKNALTKMLTVWNKTDDEAKAIAKDILNNFDQAQKVVFGESKPILERIIELKDYLVDKSVWVIGGDGWAYDIGFGGLDHVLAQGRNVNVLVLDTEVYSNTGGQKSKSTPLAAIAKFAAGGKSIPKKSLGIMMTTYGYIYVAQVNLGANKNQVIKAFLEAERFNGPSIIIAYAPCIAHGIDMAKNLEIAKKGTDSGYWPIFRFDPNVGANGQNPFQLDSKEFKPELFSEYLSVQKRFSSLKVVNPKDSEELFAKATKLVTERFNYVKGISEIGNKKEEPKTE